MLPWQKWLAVHALELKPDGTYRFRHVCLLIARQQGKSTFLLMLALWRMYVDQAALVIGTAQNLDVAEELWNAAVETAQAIPELDELIEHVDRTNGKKALRLATGERYKVAAASRRGGRGLSGDLVLLDELREHRNWDAWAAVTKTTRARRIAQVWAASNAGDAHSVVLRRLRALAHRSLGWPDGTAGLAEIPETDDVPSDALAIFEWSAAPDRDKWDRDGWCEANPSLGYTVTEAAIAADVATDPDEVTLTETLCQWVDSLAVTGRIPLAVWEATRLDGTKPTSAAKIGLELRTGLEQSLSIVAAYHHGELGVIDLCYFESGSETTWPDGYAADKVVSLCQAIGVERVFIDDHGDGNVLLAADLERRGLEVTQLKINEARAGAVGLVDGLINHRIMHPDGQDPLTVAALEAQTRPSQDGFLWSQAKSSVDIGPIRAASTAWHALTVAAELEYDLAASIY